MPIDVPEDDECGQDQVLDYRLFLDREDEVTLNDEVSAYLATPQGQFEVWYAERERRRGASRGTVPPRRAGNGRDSPR